MVPVYGSSEADPVEGYRELLDRAVEKLPGQQQKVYLLHRRQGLSHAEIAHQLNLSVETVKKHMTLALKAIRNDLCLSGRQADILVMILTVSLVFGS
jgi:RNA polymerase sigma-70 factor (ECF subfamily)